MLRGLEGYGRRGVRLILGNKENVYFMEGWNVKRLSWIMIKGNIIKYINRKEEIIVKCVWSDFFLNGVFR